MNRRLALSALIGLAGLATTSQAHHSWVGIYNPDLSITVRGVVTKVLVRSPHLALGLEVLNEAGEPEQWTVEWGSPRRLAEAGFSSDVLQPGDEVTIRGEPAWTPGRKSVRMRSLIRASDGLTMTGGGRRGRGRDGRD
jgi:hypothetical protein